MTRSQMYSAILVGLVACFLTWLLMTDTSSPLQDYLLYNPYARNLWGQLIFPVFMVMMIFGLPDSEFVGYSLIFLQWFVFAWGVMLIGTLGWRLSRRSDSHL